MAVTVKSSTKTKKQRRKGPYPYSILDRNALTESLEQAGISLKGMHLEFFYQSLHKQHYPPLQEFVNNYYKQQEGGSKDADGEDDPIASSKPLKNNNGSGRKTRNRLQLPKPFLEFLTKTPDFVTMTSRVQQKLTSSDESTTKLIVELHDGQVVESVLMRYDKKGSGRASLCVSSQVGCAMGCTFCATGTMGLFGNLTTAEILEQMIHANRILSQEHQLRQDKTRKLHVVRNVVFMGMGEPLDNYNNVVAACRSMMDRKLWNLAHGRVTVSTVGLISQIRKLTQELPEVSLALSLHAPNQEARTAIVPTATRYPIDQLIDALDNHMMAYIKKKSGETFTAEERMKEGTRRRAMIEYVMLEGESSSIKCAHELGKLCENRHLVVNLIPYNATDVKDKLQCPSEERMQEFRDIVASYGTFCTIRRTMGADIASACGQLVQKSKEDAASTSSSNMVDIEDVVGATTTKSIQTITEMRAVVPPMQAKPEIAPSEKTEHGKSQGWLEQASTEELEVWTNRLALATILSASCFALTALSVVRRR